MLQGQLLAPPWLHEIMAADDLLRLTPAIELPSVIVGAPELKVPQTYRLGRTHALVVNHNVNHGDPVDHAGDVIKFMIDEPEREIMAVDVAELLDEFSSRRLEYRE